MAIIDFANRQIIAKVIYYGAAQAGVSTNVRQLSTLLDRVSMSELRHFGEGEEDTLSWCFDYIPSDAGAMPFDLLIRVFSLQAGLPGAAHRDQVLSAADAVVFVADARADRGSANRVAMGELQRSLARQDLELASIPMVIQVNHCDAGNARPADRVVTDLNPHDSPVIPSVARDGRGVLSTHREAEGATLARLRDNLAGDKVMLSLTRLTWGERRHHEEVISRHLEMIRARERPDSEDTEPLVVSELVDETTTDVSPRWGSGVQVAAPSADDSGMSPLSFGLIGFFGGLVSGVLLGFLWFG